MGGAGVEQTVGKKTGEKSIPLALRASHSQSAQKRGHSEGARRKRETSSDSEVEIVEPEEEEIEEITISDSESDASEEDEEASDDSEWEEAGSSNKGQAKIKVGKVTIEAFCVNVDDDLPGGSGEVKEELSRGEDAVNEEGGSANAEVRQKIRKMLQLGLHPDTPDAEAQQALKQANRFLTRYNLQQVDILKEMEAENEESTLAGGMKVVRLRSKVGSRSSVSNAAWISRLGCVVCNCFDCCFYTQRDKNGFSLVFYGVVTNAECAGYAFAAAFNRISVMTAGYCGEDRGASLRRGGSWRWGSGDTQTMRANYRDGLVEGLRKAVAEEKAQRKRKLAEREERRAAAVVAKREAKLAKGRAEEAAEGSEAKPEGGKVSEAGSGEAGEGDAVSGRGDGGRREGAREGSEEDEDGGSDGWGWDDSEGEGGAGDEGEWDSKWRVKAERQSHANQSQALAVLEQHCHKVAEKVLKDNKVKLHKQRALGGTGRFDAGAFRQGQEDAKQIDIKQRGIDNKPAAKKRRS